MNLSEVLKDQTMISIATVDSDGQPKVRMFNHQFIVDGKICFATSNTGSAFAELNQNPKAEIMQFARAMYVRIKGEVAFADGEEKATLKAKLAEANPKLIEMYTEEGFEVKMEIAYFVDPVISVTDFKTREAVSVEVK